LRRALKRGRCRTPAASGDALEEHLAVLHHAAPRPRRRHQHQTVAIETDAPDLVATESAAVGSGIDAGDEGSAVEGVIAAISSISGICRNMPE
jgi:hypothetical protein